MVQQISESRKKQSGVLRPVGEFFHAQHMRRLGIANTMRLAHAVNHVRYWREDAYRRSLYRDHFDELLRENGAPVRPVLEMRDGWAIDTSLSLPHLDQVLADADEIIAERGGVRTTASGTYRSYFQDIWTAADTERYPSFLNFATSSDVLAVICKYLRSVPVLSTTIPEGIRFVESNAAFDDQEGLHDSQLFHVDYYSRPNVYVLVLLHDTTFENGPWSFLPVSATRKAAKALKYWRRGKPYRLSDEEVYSVVDRGELIEFSYPRGTVLFIESSGCLHFGSRNSVKPRFQLMLGYSTLVRTDFSELFVQGRPMPARDTDPRLRRLVLDKRSKG